MNITLSGLHLESSPKLKKYAYKKTNKLLKYNPKIQNITVRLFSQESHRGKEKDYSCELTVHIPEKILELVDTQRDLEKAIDKACERMKKILVRTKEKNISKEHKRGIFNKLISRLRH